MSMDIGVARIKSTNEVIGDLIGIEIRTNDDFSSLMGMNSYFRQGIAKCSTGFSVSINEGKFNDNPTGIQANGIQDTPRLFRFDIDLFDAAAGDKHVIGTVSQCYIKDYILAGMKDGMWILRDIRCSGSNVIYH